MSSFKCVACVVVAVVAMVGSRWASVARAVPPGVGPGKQFTLFLYETPAEAALRTDAGEKGAAYWQAWGAYRVALEQAGVMRGGMPLHPADRSVQVRVRDGKPVTTAGAFASSDPPLSGFIIIEVDSLASAEAWAAKAPNAGRGVVVVSPAYPIDMPAGPK